MRSHQLALFADPDSLQRSDLKHRVKKHAVPVKESTFLGGLTARVHRWFRLTPSFGPELVQRALTEMSTPPRSVVLDPFAGAGTTLIEAKYEGHHAVGFEINPLLHFVCSTSTRWDIDYDLLAAGFARLSARFEDQVALLDRQAIEDIGIPLPPIHNVFRWWRRDVLKDLLILREAIRSECVSAPIRGFFELALAGVLVPDLTNVTLGRLQLHFIDRENHAISVWSTYKAHVDAMLRDLAEVQRRDETGRATVFLADSTNPPAEAPLGPIDRVVTSPPYPNRYSYVWNTRPHLYFLGFFDDARSASQLDLKTIGGTWGNATSALAKGRLEPEFDVVKKVILPVVDEIRRADNLMANYVLKYFNQLTRQIVVQHRLLAEQAQMAYVVGCSRIKEVYVETDVLLGRIFEGLDLGYHVTNIERFRRRHSGKDLHESTVFVKRET